VQAARDVGVVDVLKTCIPMSALWICGWDDAGNCVVMFVSALVLPYSL
jgi:hypothetical protein